MTDRPLWVQRLRDAWRQAPIVWLTGVRRVGKTVLAQSLPDAEFINCDLPGAAARLEDPEGFFRAVRLPLVVLDEVHQLPDPSRLLKIAADGFPRLKVLATGSSTLAATQKFRDSLTGRKRTVELVPVLAEELPAFGVRDLRERLLRGGLPAALLADRRPAESYAEWMDSYFARDVQELFRLGKRAGFLKLLELVLRQSGGLLDITALAKHSGVTRPTVMNWLEVFQITHVTHALRPYAEGGGGKSSPSPRSTASTPASSATSAAGTSCARRTSACSGSIWCSTPCSRCRCPASPTGATNNSGRWTLSFPGAGRRLMPLSANGTPRRSSRADSPRFGRTTPGAGTTW